MFGTKFGVIAQNHRWIIPYTSTLWFVFYFLLIILFETFTFTIIGKENLTLNDSSQKRRAVER